MTDLSTIARRRAQSQYLQLSAAEREETIQKQLSQAGVPKRFHSTSFAGFNPEEKPARPTGLSHGAPVG